MERKLFSRLNKPALSDFLERELEMKTSLTFLFKKKAAVNKRLVLKFLFNIKFCSVFTVLTMSFLLFATYP